MAKQSGLHQIRGKVGEHSYYRQTGVSSGLIRGINQGMSQRVKTGDEYANTRLNNSEFGAACHVAAQLGGLVVPKYRPMILPFSQSKMAKGVFDLSRQNTGEWGKRVVGLADTDALASILAGTSKRSISDFITLTFTAPQANQLNVNMKISEEQASMMASLGIDGVLVKASIFSVETGKYVASLGKIAEGLNRELSSSTNEVGIVAGQEVDGDIALSYTIPGTIDPKFNRHLFAVVVFMPSRSVGDGVYTLQEYCSFTAVKAPIYA